MARVTCKPFAELKHGGGAHFFLYKIVILMEYNRRGKKVLIVAQLAQ